MWQHVPVTSALAKLTRKDCTKFAVSLIYIENSTPARATYQDTVSKSKQQWRNLEGRKWRQAPANCVRMRVVRPRLASRSPSSCLHLPQAFTAIPARLILPILKATNNLFMVLILIIFVKHCCTLIAQTHPQMTQIKCNLTQPSPRTTLHRGQ